MTNEERRELTIAMGKMTNDISGIFGKTLKWNEIDVPTDGKVIDFRAPIFKNSDIPVQIGVSATLPDNNNTIQPNESKVTVTTYIYNDVVQLFDAILEQDNRGTLAERIKVPINKCLEYIGDTY